jgi:deoxyribose-phosphate aldolase
MVINIGMLKEKEYDALLSEISEIKKACKEKILKVIIETCLLTDDEIVKMCEIVSASGADFIKTSTGFDKEGATFHAVELMSTSVVNGVRVKAAGGISSLEDAEHFLEIGASRLGTSRVIKILENENSDGIKY